MAKYYHIELNNANERTIGWSGGRVGFLKCLPRVIKERHEIDGFFSKKVIIEEKTVYDGEYDMIVEKEKDYYVDVISGRKVSFDPTGLCEGLSCKNRPTYEMSPSSVASYLKHFDDPKVLEEYYKELDLIEERRQAKIRSIRADELYERQSEKLVEEYVSKFKKLRK